MIRSNHALHKDNRFASVLFNATHRCTGADLAGVDGERKDGVRGQKAGDADSRDTYEITPAMSRARKILLVGTGTSLAISATASVLTIGKQIQLIHRL